MGRSQVRFLARLHFRIMGIEICSAITPGSLKKIPHVLLFIFMHITLDLRYTNLVSFL